MKRQASEYFISVATIVEQDGRFLMVEEQQDGRRVFNQPAGHVEPGESVLDAAIRESLEETAWNVTLQHLTGVYVLDLGDAIYHRYCFAAAANCFTARKLDPDIVATHWMTAESIRKANDDARLRSPLVIRCLEDYLHGRRFPLDLIFECK